MQFTRNVSLYRLPSEPVDAVLAERHEYEGLGLVHYELLPHLNRLDATFLEKVRLYSEKVAHDVVALEDGSAMLHAPGVDPRCAGRGARFRGGVRSSMDTA